MSTRMLPCDEVMRRLWAFLDGELEPASEQEVRDHLALCKRCFPRLDFQRAYFRLMQRVAGAPAAEGVRARVIEALVEEAARD